MGCFVQLRHCEAFVWLAAKDERTGGHADGDGMDAMLISQEPDAVG